MDLNRNRSRIMFLLGGLLIILGLIAVTSYGLDAAIVLLVSGAIFLVLTPLGYLMNRHYGVIDYARVPLSDFKAKVDAAGSGTASALTGEVILAEIRGLAGVQGALAPLYDICVTNRRLFVVTSTESRSTRLEKGLKALAVDVAAPPVTRLGAAGTMAESDPSKIRDEGKDANGSKSVDLSKLDDIVKAGENNFSAPYGFVKSITMKRMPGLPGQFGVAEVDFGDFGRTFGLTKGQYSLMVSTLSSVKALSGKLNVKD